MNQNEENHIDLNKRTEGDINFSAERAKWLKNDISEKAKTLLEKDARYFLHQSLSTPCLDVLQDSKGPFIQSVSGKSYLDFHGNNVHQLGFSHPKLVARLTDQLQSLTFSTRRYTNEIAINFAEKLASLLPSDLNRTL